MLNVRRRREHELAADPRHERRIPAALDPWVRVCVGGCVGDCSALVKCTWFSIHHFLHSLFLFRAAAGNFFPNGWNHRHPISPLLVIKVLVLRLEKSMKEVELHLMKLNFDVVNLDFDAHLRELPYVPLEQAPNKLSLITDALIFKWFFANVCQTAWELALQLGGPTLGYNEEWVVQRFCYLVDRENNVVDRPKTNRQHSNGEKKQGRRLWSSAEDEKMRLFIHENGTKWRFLARHLGGKKMGFTDDSVRNRFWRLHGDDSSMKVRRKKIHTSLKSIRWTKEEDQRIIDYVSTCGREWKNIGQLFGNGRTPAAVRLRAGRLGIV